MALSLTYDWRKVVGLKINNNFSNATCEAITLHLKYREGALTSEEEFEEFFVDNGMGSGALAVGSLAWCQALFDNGVCWMPSSSTFHAANFHIGEPTDGNHSNLYKDEKPILAIEWIQSIINNDSELKRLSRQATAKSLNTALNRHWVKISNNGLNLMRNDFKLEEERVVRCHMNTHHPATDNDNSILSLKELIDMFHARVQVGRQGLGTQDGPQGHDIPVDNQTVAATVAETGTAEADAFYDDSSFNYDDFRMPPLPSDEVSELSGAEDEENSQPIQPLSAEAFSQLKDLVGTGLDANRLQMNAAMEAFTNLAIAGTPQRSQRRRRIATNNNGGVASAPVGGRRRVTGTPVRRDVPTGQHHIRVKRNRTFIGL